MKLDTLNTKISDVEAIVLTPQHCVEVFGQGEIMDNELDMINTLMDNELDMINTLMDNELDMINTLLFVQDNHEFATIYPLIRGG